MIIHHKHACFLLCLSLGDPLAGVSWFRGELNCGGIEKVNKEDLKRY